MNENRESKSATPALRASDAEREHVAKLVSEAAGEGRLTLAEAEERLEQVYVVTYRGELDRFTADLPNGRATAAGPRSSIATRAAGLPSRLRVHAAVAVVLSVFLIMRFVASGAEFFWPAGPMFLLWGSLAVHASVVARSSRAGDRWVRQRRTPPWTGNTNEGSNEGTEGRT
ncbi:MAG: DUF1707 domain-containing protein [Actinophytocola sp.]|uniref:DUF1707 SHOCT-like domain-containing protein n=1 Tax=Actinophytocola sp. TaxID=1872138 RepID=UPI0013213690|nr:DUF1707 domain-containing protein [Actinophytocola sp.]MPZ81093.1 DUF1707 domain-containing protein [Actinophytocola sp.]